MDLVVGARRVIVTMTAASASGAPKVVEACTYPLTAVEAVDVIITELAVFRIRERALHLVELLGGATVDQVRAVTAARFAIQLDG